MKKVLIFGGTHGNEWTGIQVIKHYGDFFKKKFPTLDLEFIFANPKAFERNRRFVDEDLNRAFQFLGEERPHSYEHQRALELRRLIQKQECLIIDLHTTTANMRKTIIVSHYNTVTLSICSKLVQNFPDCRVIGAPDPSKKYLASQSDFGLILELGPVSNCVIDAHQLEATLQMLEFIFEALKVTDRPSHGSVEIFEETLNVTYPLTPQGEINGYIHSAFQGKDFAPIDGDYVPFKLFDGSDLRAKTEEKLYPIFINEAAYYPQHLAFTLCKKVNLTY